jgi:hypothetical protein
MMKRLKKVLVIAGISACFIAALSVSSFSATKTFQLSGQGSIDEQTPAGYDGFIYSGDLTGFGFVIHIDDTGWPVDNPATPTINERWDYIVATYFVYDATPGAEHWDGYFPMIGQVVPVVTWRFTNTPDKLGGVIRYLTISIHDADHDGVLDPSERENQAVAANYHCHIEQSTGEYIGQCGIGSMNGTLQDLPNIDDTLTGSGSLSLRSFGCPVPTDAPSWGIIKSIYAE